MHIEEARYRSRASQVLAAIVAILCAVGAVAAFFGGWEAGLRSVPWYALAIFVVWLLFWNPSLAIQKQGVTVVNVFSTEVVPWQLIQQIDTRFALTLYTPGRKVSVWSAPAAGRHRILGLSRSDFDGISESARGEHGGLRPSDATSTPTGNLAEAVRRPWEALQRSGAYEHSAGTAQVQRTWHVRSIAVLAVLIALCAISVLV